MADESEPAQHSARRRKDKAAVVSPDGEDGGGEGGGEGGAAADGGGGGAPAAYAIHVAMESLMDKLRLLNFDVDFYAKHQVRPLTRLHFALPGNSAEQLHGFACLMSWLLSLVGHKFPAPQQVKKEKKKRRKKKRERKCKVTGSFFFFFFFHSMTIRTRSPRTSW